MDRQAHAGAVRAAQHLSVDGAEVQDRLGRNQFGDADKNKLAESVELESSAYMGATQLNNYLSLFGTRRWTSCWLRPNSRQNYWRWI